MYICSSFSPWCTPTESPNSNVAFALVWWMCFVLRSPPPVNVCLDQTARRKAPLRFEWISAAQIIACIWNVLLMWANRSKETHQPAGIWAKSGGSLVRKLCKHHANIYPAHMPTGLAGPQRTPVLSLLPPARVSSPVRRIPVQLPAFHQLIRVVVIMSRTRLTPWQSPLPLKQLPVYPTCQHLIPNCTKKLALWSICRHNFSQLKFLCSQFSTISSQHLSTNHLSHILHFTAPKSIRSQVCHNSSSHLSRHQIQNLNVVSFPNHTSHGSNFTPLYFSNPPNNSVITTNWSHLDPLSRFRSPPLLPMCIRTFICYRLW